jgi:hypothetical protein
LKSHIHKVLECRTGTMDSTIVETPADINVNVSGKR